MNLPLIWPICLTLVSQIRPGRMVWAGLEGSNAPERILELNMGILRALFVKPGLSLGHNMARCRILSNRLDSLTALNENSRPRRAAAVRANLPAKRHPSSAGEQPSSRPPRGPLNVPLYFYLKLKLAVCSLLSSRVSFMVRHWPL